MYGSVAEPLPVTKFLFSVGNAAKVDAAVDDVYASGSGVGCRPLKIWFDDGVVTRPLAGALTPPVTSNSGAVITAPPVSTTAFEALESTTKLPPVTVMAPPV